MRIFPSEVVDTSIERCQNMVALRRGERARFFTGSAENFVGQAIATTAEQAKHDASSISTTCRHDAQEQVD